MRPNFVCMEMKIRIAEKARELFMRYGIKSITMDEIATQMGISKKTIYQHFVDKDALVLEVFMHVMQQNKAAIIKSKELAENAVHEQFLCSDVVSEMFAHMNPMLLFDMQRFHPLVHKQFEQYKKQFVIGIIQQNIERGIHEEVYRADIDVHLISWLMLESNFICMHQPEIRDSITNLAKVEKQLTDFFLHGLSTTKGIKLIQKYKKQRLKTSK